MKIIKNFALNLVIIVLVILCLGIVNVVALEMRITTNTSEQKFPAISGNRIVWDDNRNGNHDIYMYDLSTNIERRITTNTAEQKFPAISGNRIVWTDYRNINPDIYMYDLSTNTEKRITTNTADQETPRISGNRIVWTDWRNGGNLSDIYMYDISTGIEKLMIGDSEFQYGPSISGNRIIYSYVSGDISVLSSIYMYDISTNTVKIIRSDTAFSSAIDGTRIVWQDDRREMGTSWDIYMYDLSTNTEKRITTNIAKPSNPAISGNRIVWEDWRNGNPDIYMYDLSTNTEKRITTNTAGQYSPAISGNRIVWTDLRNGNFDIYMNDISSSPSSITVTFPNGRENWARGNTQTIRWNYAGSPGSKVKIELLKGGVINRIINSSTSVGSSGSGSYNWLINSTQTLGSDYKVRITSTTNSAYKDTSNNNFTISVPVNLLKNPGFETMSSTIPQYWSKSQTGINAVFTYPEIGRVATGKSVAIRYATKETGKVAIWQQSGIIVVPSKQYKLSGYMKLASVTGGGTGRLNGASLRINWYTSTGTLIKTDLITRSGTSVWTKYENTFTSPSNAVKANVGGDLFNSSGKVTIDDMSFMRIS